MRKGWRKGSIPGLHQQVNQTYNHLSKTEVRRRYGLGTGDNPGGEIGKEAVVVTPLGVWFDGKFYPALQEFNAAFAAWENPATRTPIITTNIHSARKELVVEYATLYNGVIKKCPLGTDEDLAAMGLPVYSDVAPTPSPDPDSQPLVRTNLPSVGVVEIFFTYSGGHKPRSIHGAEIRYAILDREPESFDDLIHSDFATASPHRLAFDVRERGKRLFFAVRWENMRGVKGPWTEIFCVIIP